jgi:hypothetical protein
MPLLKTAVQFAGAAALLNVGAKAFDRHEKIRAGNTAQLLQQQASAGAPYGHQPYCNGACGDQCKGVGSCQHQPSCNGMCGGRCNGINHGQSFGRGSSMSRASPQQRHLDSGGQGQSPYGSQRTIGVGDRDDVNATPPPYEYGSPYGGDSSGKTRDTQS